MENKMPKVSGSSSAALPLVLFIVVLLGAVFYVKPTWDESSSLALGRDDKLQQKQQLQQKLTDLQKIQQELNQASEVSKQTSLSSIPEKLEEDKLILDLSGIALKNDIILNSVNFSVPSNAPKGKIAKSVVNANLQGTEGALIGFLRDVESNARKLNVKSITIQVGSRDAANPLSNFNVNMETYYQGEI
jgi:Tfp pilus assembly protein PilO